MKQKDPNYRAPCAPTLFLLTVTAHHSESLNTNGFQSPHQGPTWPFPLCCLPGSWDEVRSWYEISEFKKLTMSGVGVLSFPCPGAFPGRPCVEDAHDLTLPVKFRGEVKTSSSFA